MFEGGKVEMGCVVGLETDELRERWRARRPVYIWDSFGSRCSRGFRGNEMGGWRLGWMGCLGGRFATADVSDVHFI